MDKVFVKVSGEISPKKILGTQEKTTVHHYYHFLFFSFALFKECTVYDRSSSTPSDRSKDKEHPTYTFNI
jgi:hypothetical protein